MQRRAVLRTVEGKGYFLLPFAAAALAPFCFFVFAVFFGLLSPIVVLLFPANITADAISSRKWGERHKRGRDFALWALPRARSREERSPHPDLRAGESSLVARSPGEHLSWSVIVPGDPQKKERAWHICRTHSALGRSL